MAEAVKELYKYNADELIKQQCRAREEYYQRQRTLHKAIKDANAEKDQAVAEKIQAMETIQVKDQLIAEMQKQLVEMQRQLVEMQKQLAQNQKESDDGKK